MSRSGFGLATLVLCLAMATPASAQSGLYEPFPSAAQSRRAERFVGKLGAPTGLSDLRRGTFSGGELSPVGPGPATSRAGATAGAAGGAWFWVLAAGLILVLAAPAALAAARRRG